MPTEEEEKIPQQHLFLASTLHPHEDTSLGHSDSGAEKFQDPNRREQITKWML